MDNMFRAIAGKYFVYHLILSFCSVLITCMVAPSSNDNAMLPCICQQNELEKENEELNMQLKVKKAKKVKLTVRSTERTSASFFSDNEDYEDSDEDPDWIATPRVIKVPLTVPVHADAESTVMCFTCF